MCFTAVLHIQQLHWIIRAQYWLSFNSVFGLHPPDYRGNIISLPAKCSTLFSSLSLTVTVCHLELSGGFWFNLSHTVASFFRIVILYIVVRNSDCNWFKSSAHSFCNWIWSSSKELLWLKEKLELEKLLKQQADSVWQKKNSTEWWYPTWTCIHGRCFTQFVLSLFDIGVTTA